MPKKSLYNKQLKAYARRLRNESTFGEIILWSKVLRAKKMLGYQFNRQFPIHHYIVDFLCRELKLIIEIDGYSHDFKYKQDIERDRFINSHGYCVLRFSEQQVRHKLDDVIEVIENEIIRLKQVDNKENQ